jgi:Na+-driven multidrug efflux pump
MRIILTAVAMNLILNPLFIFKFGWGIKGSALATVISQAISFIIACSHFCQKSSFVRFRRAAFVFDWKIIKAIISIGLAPFMVNICASMVAAFVNTALLKYGGTGVHDVVKTTHASADIYVGAYGIANRVVMLLIMVIQGLNQGMQPIAGYNYGAKQYSRVKEVFWMTAKFGTIVTTICFCIGMFIPRLAAGIFTHDEALLNMSEEGLRILTIGFPIVGFQMIGTNFFQCLGMVKKSIILSLSRQLLFLLPLLYCLPLWMGANGVWMSFPISDVLSALLTAILLRRLFKKSNILKDGAESTFLGSNL